MARILVVDDQSPVRSLIAGCLRIEGHDVTTASSGVEAIAVLLHDRHDLLVIDLAMPGLSGYETVEQIRETPSIAAVPVIALSGDGALANLTKADELAILAHVQKPVGFHELEDAIRRAFETTADVPEEVMTLKNEAVSTYRQSIDLIREVRASTEVGV